ncbi:MAG: hypothetical protein R3263_08085, partial [Myxococcota bacterium]|nr:hypothetical protein [Myxococcota bacterium]
MREAARRAALRALRAADLLRLRVRRVLAPGLRVAPGASSNFAHARLCIAPGAVVRLGAGAVTERRPGWLSLVAEEGAEIVVGEGAWLRTEVAPVCLVAYAGARLHVGPGALLNGCTVSAKREVRIGERALLGPGTRVYDADQHDRDAEHPEEVEPVHIGDHAWIAADSTVLRGVRIG